MVTLLADHAGVALRQAALVSTLESLALTDSLPELLARADAALYDAKRAGRDRVIVA